MLLILRDFGPLFVREHYWVREKGFAYDVSCIRGDDERKVSKKCSENEKNREQVAVDDCGVVGRYAITSMGKLDGTYLHLIDLLHAGAPLSLKGHKLDDDSFGTSYV